MYVSSIFLTSPLREQFIHKIKKNQNNEKHKISKENLNIDSKTDNGR